MSRPIYEKIANTTFVIIGVGVALVLAYMILKYQQAEVLEYCKTLLDNGTIRNISECNITALAYEAPL